MCNRINEIPLGILSKRGIVVFFLDQAFLCTLDDSILGFPVLIIIPPLFRVLTVLLALSFSCFLFSQASRPLAIRGFLLFFLEEILSLFCLGTVKLSVFWFGKLFLS